MIRRFDPCTDAGTETPVDSPDARPIGLADTSDEDLLLRYRSERDCRVFEELAQRYEGQLLRYLRRFLDDADMADDALQQTFLQVHLKCDQFDPARKVCPWLYRIATNQAIDLQRRNQRHRMVSLDRCKSADDWGRLLDLLVHPGPAPDKKAETAEQRLWIRQVVAKLPKRPRQIVILVYFQGLKYREAAEVLSIPLGTVKSRLRAAVVKLGEMIEPLTDRRAA